MTDSVCSRCGAAFVAGLVACTFCETPYPGAPAGIDCPKCHDDNLPSRTACARCGMSLVRGCIFCGHGTSVALAQCARCGEAFDGAEQRKRAREDAARQQQILGLAATGLTALGAAAASPMGRSLLGQLVDGIKNEIDES